MAGISLFKLRTLGQFREIKIGFYPVKNEIIFYIQVSVLGQNSKCASLLFVYVIYVVVGQPVKTPNALN